MYGSPQLACTRGGTYQLGAALSRRPALRRLSRGMGAITADQAAETIFPLAQVKKSAGHNQSVRDQMVQSAQAGQMLNAQGAPAYVPGTGQCAATGQSTNVKLAQISGGMALTGIQVAAATGALAIGAALGPLTLGISTVIGLFPLLFGHHAKAVKKEQSVLCAAVPAANNYLQIIDQAVQSGQATPQSAMAALDSLASDFRSQVSSIMHGNDPTSSGECNAACVMYSQLRAIVALKKSQYQDLVATVQSTNAPITSQITSALAPITTALAPVQQAIAAAGLPGWVLPAAGALLLWKLI